MADGHDIPDEVLDALADGRAADGAAASSVSAYLHALQAENDATAAVPTEALHAVLAEGITDATRGILTAELRDEGILTRGILTAETDEGILTRGILTAEADRGILTRGILTMRVRSRTWARVLVAKFMALGMLAKGGVAMAAVTVATTTAGATGVLPGPAQDVFDDIVQVGDADEDEDAPSDVGERVSQDATGESDGEPGVDGAEVACEVSGDRAPHCAEDEAPGDRGAATAEDASDGRSTAGAENGADRPDTPAGDAPTEGTPAGDAPTEPPAPREPTDDDVDGDLEGGGGPAGGGGAPSDPGGQPAQGGGRTAP